MSARTPSARSTRAVRRTARGAALVVALTTLAGALAGPAHAAHVDAKDKWPGGSTRIVAR